MSEQQNPNSSIGGTAKLPAERFAPSPDTPMKIYHGSPSPTKFETAREHAPSYTHGAQWAPQKMTDHDWPYFLDNGAFRAHINGEPWDVDTFVKRLNELSAMPRPPDFVVLPDVVTDPKATVRRGRIWAQRIDWPLAFAVQNGISPERAVDVATELGCTHLFVGGTPEWKRRNAEAFVTASHAAGLKCHIGRPNNLQWAEQTGADSVDTTTIVRNESYSLLDQLEAEQSLQQYL